MGEGMGGTSGRPPEAGYQITAVVLLCPHCGRLVSGLDNAVVVVQGDPWHGGQVAVCESCAQPFVVPDVVDQLRDIPEEDSP